MKVVNQSKTEFLPRGVQWSFELMAIMYVAVAVLFMVNPDWLILITNKAFDRYGWPVVFFPTERFWFSLAVSVPGTRAFAAFAAARRPTQARVCIKVLQVSLLLAAALFSWQFVFGKHAPLYVLGFFIEIIQVVFYLFLSRRVP
jgi:hypothetical protein